MSTLIFVLHIVLCVFLILLVLLQQGKGADAGAIMGSGADAFVGAGSGGTFISRLTTGIAIAFMVTSLLLVNLSKTAMVNDRPGNVIDVTEGSLLKDQLPEQQAPNVRKVPAAQATQAVTPAPAETPAADETKPAETAQPEKSAE